MKIAEFIVSLEDGGAETLVKDYSILLSKKGHNICIITKYPSFSSSNYNIVKENKDIKYYSIYPQKNIVFRSINRLFGQIIAPLRLLYILKKEKIKVLHIHMELLKIVKPIWRYLKNIKLFYTCHNYPDYYFSGSNRKEYDCAKWLIEHNNLRLIALHNQMKRELDNMFLINNTLLVRNGVDADRFIKVLKEGSELRRNYNIPQNAFVVGHVGRFSNQKNHDFLVDVFNVIKKTNRDAFLLMVGSGKLRDLTEKKIASYGLEDSYLILEHRSDIPEIMKCMDVFVFPSIFEGFPLTLVEAQFSGLRCIVSNEINEEVILSKDTIPLSIYETPEKWATVVLSEIENDSYYDNLVEYNINNIISYLEMIYMEQ